MFNKLSNFFNWLYIYPTTKEAWDIILSLSRQKGVFDMVDLNTTKLKIFVPIQGRIQGRGRTRRTPPLILEKLWFFGRKIVIFHTKYPITFRASLRNWQKYDFLA